MRVLPPLLVVIGALLWVPAWTQPAPHQRSGAKLWVLLHQHLADAKHMPLLLELGTFYLNKAERMPADLDSALLLAQQAEALSQQLRQKSDAEAARFLAGQVYIQQGANHRLQVLMNQFSDTTRIKLTLEQGKHQLQAGKAQPTHPDSARYFFQRAAQLSAGLRLRKWQHESLFQLGTYYIQHHELPAGQACFAQVIAAEKQALDKAAESRAWFRMGEAFVAPGPDKSLAERLHCFIQAQRLARQAGDRPQEALSFLNVAITHIYQRQPELAERELQAVVATQKALGHQPLYLAYDALFGLESNRGNYDKALAYLLQMVSSLEASGHDELLDGAYFELGILYQELNEPAKSVAYLRKSLAFSQRKGQVMVDDYLTKKLTKGLVDQGKIGEALAFLQEFGQRKPRLTARGRKALAESLAYCYIAQKQYLRAEQYLLQSIALNSQVDFYEALPAGQTLSQVYLLMGQYGKARPYLQQLLAVPKGVLPASILASVHLASFKVDSAQGHYVAAIGHLRRHNALVDSIFTAAKTRQVEELQVKYQTGQQKQRIQLLTERGRRQQSELQRAQTTRNSLLAGAGLLTLLLGVSYNRYRVKQRGAELLARKQQEINRKNEVLEQVLGEKNGLLAEKSELLTEQDKLLAEKEWMLKEIHHRVKNNLQIISSLLNTQSLYLGDAPAQAAIRDSRNRVQAMALIHQKLYQSDSLARVNMQEYTQEIVSHLVDSFDGQARIQQRLDLFTVSLDVALATPISLIINEAVTNSLKHAFSPNQAGTIAIGLFQLAPQRYQLTIDDDGVGLPAGFDVHACRSMGLTIIKGLSSQLHGQLTIAEAGGVRLALDFAAATPTAARVLSA
jgi:two-component sensor histidine kinase/tetratricopeptide (TPR) repeat protein